MEVWGRRVSVMEDSGPQAESQKVLVVRMMWRDCHLGRTALVIYPEQLRTSHLEFHHVGLDAGGRRKKDGKGLGKGGAQRQKKGPRQIYNVNFCTLQ